MSIPTARCPSCDHKKYSATKNPSGLCDECNGGRSKKSNTDALASLPGPAYWYQCQERAMAPGSGDGWPATIRPQHSANARLVRRDGDPEKEITALTAEVARLREALERQKVIHAKIALAATHDGLKEFAKAAMAEVENITAALRGGA